MFLLSVLFQHHQPLSAINNSYKKGWRLTLYIIIFTTKRPLVITIVCQIIALRLMRTRTSENVRQSISINKTSVGIYSFCFSRKSQVSCERDKKRRPPRLSIYSLVNTMGRWVQSSMHQHYGYNTIIHAPTLLVQENLVIILIMTDLS